MVAAITTPTLVLLVVISLFAGVGITAVGPGGVFVTVALYALTDVPPAVVVGTASATFVATGVLGSLSYVRSGELAGDGIRQQAVVLSVTGFVGALLGVWLNAVLPVRFFGYALGGLVSITGLLVWYRTRYGIGGRLDPGSEHGLRVGALVGSVVGLSGGLLGIGGPVLAVPLLVAFGFPLLPAIAVAQVQSVFIAAFATAGYVVRDAVSWPLAVAIGVPELVGVVIGWQVAQTVDTKLLTRILAVLMLVLGPYIALS